jgi:hypothetical protein
MTRGRGPALAPGWVPPPEIEYLLGWVPTRRKFLQAGMLLALLGAAVPARAADTWSTPYTGVRHLYRTTTTPWRIFALEVDLCASGVSLRATASSERWRTVSSFGKLVGAQAAVNGDFFSFTTHATSGLAVGNGVRWTDTKDTASSGFVAFGWDRLLLSPVAAVVEPPPGWMREVVSGRPRIVNGGVAQASDPTEFCWTRHPRTAAGFSKDRRKLYLAVVDGRTSISVGMKCTELGKLMAELGAWDALNLDGGGSSAMWVASKGVVNNPSDGNERTVSNHLGVNATGAGEPGSCDRSFEESATQGDAYDASTTSDVDGDKKADLCARSASGFSCALSSGAAFSSLIAGPELSDASGWSDQSNWSTLRMGDVNGDGRADVCARANARVYCWLSDGAGFPTRIDGPELSDASGWNAPEYYGTIRLADVDGDGKDDLCARSASDFRCYPATGSGFGAPFGVKELSNAAGFDQPRYYGTIRMGDVDGDGRADVCARAAAGMRCWLAMDGAFSAAIDGPAWSDAGGWGELQFWSTIRLADVDGDGRADLCGRAAAGFRCHLSTGSGFSEAIPGPEWSDAKGWSRHKYYSTIRLADIDGDGDLDVCARAAAGIICAPWNGTGFDPTFAGPALSDDSGWGAHRFYSTIRFVDVDDDGKRDLCARAAAGMKCWPSQGTAFGPSFDGPAWSDAASWGKPEYYSTLRAEGPRCSGPSCNPPDPPDGGAGQGGTSGAIGNGGTGAGWTDGGASGGSGGSGGTNASPSEGGDAGGCGCSLPARAPRTLPLLIAALALLARFRRGPACEPCRSS